MNNPLSIYERRLIALIFVLAFACFGVIGRDYKTHEQFCFETAQKMLNEFKCSNDPIRTAEVLQRIHALAVGSERYYDLRFEGKPINQQVFIELENRCNVKQTDSE